MLSRFVGNTAGVVVGSTPALEPYIDDDDETGVVNEDTPASSDSVGDVVGDVVGDRLGGGNCVCLNINIPIQMFNPSNNSSIHHINVHWIYS